MALVVEDGSGIAGANTYVLSAFVTTYLGERGRVAENGWQTVGGTVQDQAVLAAGDFIEARFAKRWQGDREFPTVQILAWPRLNVVVDGVDVLGIPLQLQKAQAEYAVRALSSAGAIQPLQPDPTQVDGQQVPAQGPVTGTRVKAGPVEDETTFAAPSFVPTSTGMVAYPAADALIAALLHGTAIFGRVSHA